MAAKYFLTRAKESSINRFEDEGTVLIPIRSPQILKEVRYILTAGHCTEHGLDWKDIGRNVDSPDQVRALVGQAERLGESLDDTSLLLSALFGQWIVNFIRFNGEVALKLASRFLALGDKEKTAVPLIVGNVQAIHNGHAASQLALGLDFQPMLAPLRASCRIKG